MSFYRTTCILSWNRHAFSAGNACRSLERHAVSAEYACTFSWICISFHRTARAPNWKHIISIETARHPQLNVNACRSRAYHPRVGRSTEAPVKPERHWISFWFRRSFYRTACKNFQLKMHVAVFMGCCRERREKRMNKLKGRRTQGSRKETIHLINEELKRSAGAAVANKYERAEHMYHFIITSNKGRMMVMMTTMVWWINLMVTITMHSMTKMVIMSLRVIKIRRRSNPAI